MTLCLNYGHLYTFRERAEDKADGAQKPESRQVGMRISSTDQRRIRVAQLINRGSLMITVKMIHRQQIIKHIQEQTATAHFTQTQKT
ncbi:hypothetical protein CR161_05040 [Prosthecochloris sp. ZM]|nr:hypothetical protein CR161_05040 [Prosthecochloris sp. ZM]